MERAVIDGDRRVGSLGVTGLTELERLTDIAERARLLLDETTDPARRRALEEYATECEAQVAALKASPGAGSP